MIKRYHQSTIWRVVGQCPGEHIITATLWRGGLVLLLIGALTACSGVGQSIGEVQNSPPVQNASSTSTVAPASPTQTPTGTPSPSPSPSPTPLPTTTSTPDPYAGMTIEDLAERTYGGGDLLIEDTYGSNEAFSRYLFSYPSDGIKIFGFMNVPRRVESLFPVVIALHGYIDPAVYTTLDYTTRYADALARAGYLVLHPNLRGYPPSDGGPNLFRVGMAIDVLNLIALLQQQGGQPGPLENADPERIGLWGHSMGGGITTRVITVNSDVRAAVLYGSMSGDETRNFTKILEWSAGERGLAELAVPPEDLIRISPAYHLARIQSAVSIHHGSADELVPLDWSLEICQNLQELGKAVECFTYPGQPHTFNGEGDLVFNQRVVDFFDRYLRVP